MTVKFNKISLYSNVVKNLLASTYLPLVRSVREGDYICKGRLYIFRCEVIKCTKSGYIGSKNYLSNFPIAAWTMIQEFHFGDKDGKLSTNFISNSEGYDYRTHERFGQYLRNLRDMYGLNLMPLYNCFSNQPLENHIIEKDKIVQTSRNNNTKIYKIPIRFNQDYTVCIENIGVTTIAPALIRYNTLLKQNNTKYGNGVDVTNQYLSLHKFDNMHSFANLSFGKPIKVRFNNVPETKTIKYRKITPTTPEIHYRKTSDDIKSIPATYSGKKYYVKNGTEYQEVSKLPIVSLNTDKLYEQMHWKYDEDSEQYIVVGDNITFNCQFRVSFNDSGSISTIEAVRVNSRNSDPILYVYAITSDNYRAMAHSDNSVSDAWVLEEELINSLYLYNADENMLSISDIRGYWLDVEDGVDIYEVYEQPMSTINDLEASYEISDEVVNQYADIEDNLYMLIQVPKVFNQNIVVLEGDYTHLESNKLVDYLYINDLPDFLYDAYYTHDLNLMNGTSTEPRPFSPTLIEYILWNAISTLDTINNDMDRLSIELQYKDIPRTQDIDVLPNYWVPRYRQLISDYVRADGRNVTQDNLGYATRDVEEYMYKDV